MTVTCGEQQRGGRGRDDFRRRAVVGVEVSRLETVPVTRTSPKNKNVSKCEQMSALLQCVPPIDQDAHQHQQTQDGESGDHGQRNDGPLLPLHTADQPDVRFVTAVASLWREKKKKRNDAGKVRAKKKKKKSGASWTKLPVQGS